MSERDTKSVAENYDRIASEFARQLFHELEHKPMDRELLTRFAAATAGRGQVCDMGCGPGQIARFLRDAGADVFGLDLSPQMVAEAKRLNPDLAFREGNMMALDLKNESLAGITAFYAIVNIPQESLPQVFSEMHRVLQPAGLLLLTFHTGGKMVQIGEMFGRPVSMDFFFYDPAAIAELLEQAGLAVEEIIERGPYAPEVEHQSHRAYVFARKEIR